MTYLLLICFVQLGKFYIHQTKWSNLKPNFARFQTALKLI